MREDILDSIAEYVTQNTKMKAVDGPFCKLLRENLDRKFGPAWHVFVGKNFGCYAIHDNNSFANFKYKIQKNTHHLIPNISKPYKLIVNQISII